MVRNLNQVTFSTKIRWIYQGQPQSYTVLHRDAFSGNLTWLENWNPLTQAHHHAPSTLAHKVDQVKLFEVFLLIPLL